MFVLFQSIQKQMYELYGARCARLAAALEWSGAQVQNCTAYQDYSWTTLHS